MIADFRLQIAEFPRIGKVHGSVIQALENSGREADR
jgi:hypothetical protein